SGERDVLPWLGAPRDQANCLRGLYSPRIESQIIRPRQPRRDFHSLSSADHAVISRSASDGQVEAVVGEDKRFPSFVWFAEPPAQAIDEPLFEQVRFENASVEEQHVGPGGIVP